MNEPNGGFPASLTESITLIQSAVLDLSWTDLVLGRAMDFEVTMQGGKKVLAPRVYDSDGEYIDGRPDDTRRSVVFFRAARPENADFKRATHNQTHRIRSNRDVTLYGWIKINPASGQSPDYAEETVKVTLYQALKPLTTVIEIRQFNDGRFSEVFEPYTFGDDNDWQQYDRYPFVCFRMDITVMFIEPKPL